MTLSRSLLLFATITCAALVGGAFIFEWLGYAPCKLCWWQRYGHFGAVGFGLLALGFGARPWAWGAALSTAWSSGIGAWHSGIERGWWPGPANCTSRGVEGLSVEDLMAQINEAPLVLCDQIPWRLSDMIPLEFLDITMAQINAVGSAVLVLVWIAAIRNAQH